ncbi:MAG: outer membrane protein assembly factor BamD [Bacteroidia bacterium]|nr:outer membrane protein assembly factor BamD [Bacteroidia bacterium]
MMILNTIYYNIRSISLSLIGLFIFSSCGEYQAIVKTGNPDYMYKSALKYYENGDFNHAAGLFEMVLSTYNGTSRYDTILVSYAKSLANIGDYYTAASYFQNYVKTFPSSDSCETCQFMTGYCYYMLSPKIELDQSDSETAITELSTFIDMYPNSPKVPLAEKMLRRMQDKMSYKEYKSAKLYFNLGNYLGNNYNSAVITARNCLRKYPDTRHREELSFLILRSLFIQAENSILEKQSERYRETIDEYYSFVNEFPDSQYLKKAQSILKDSERGLTNAETLLPPNKDELEYYKTFGRREKERQREAEQAAKEARDAS